MDKVLENIDGKVKKVESSNLQVLNMIKMLETQIAQLAGHLSSNEGKLPKQPQSPETAKAIQTCSGKEIEEPEHTAGARKHKPRVEVKTIIKVKAPTPTPEIVTEEPEFELDDIDTKILPPRPRYRKGKHEDEC